MSDSENPRTPTPTSESQKYIVDDLLERRRVHLVTGPSGVGKTRWLLPLVAEWIQGKDVLDKKSYPLPCGYLVCDRPAEDAKSTIEKMYLDRILTPDRFPIRSWMDESEDKIRLETLPKLFPKAKVVFIESIAALVPTNDRRYKGVNDYQSVMRFFRALHSIIRPYDLTIVATIHPPKTKKGEGYIQARDAIRGSNAWAECSNTIFCVERKDEKDPNGPRSLLVLPRDGEEFEIDLDWNGHNQLVPGTTNAVDAFMLDEELDKLPLESILFTHVMHEWGETHKINKRTVERWITENVDSGRLERIRKGAYKTHGKN
jgi:hypothetical protein